MDDLLPPGKFQTNLMGSTSFPTIAEVALRMYLHLDQANLKAYSIKR